MSETPEDCKKRLHRECQRRYRENKKRKITAETNGSLPAQNNISDFSTTNTNVSITHSPTEQLLGSELQQHIILNNDTTLNNNNSFTTVTRPVSIPRARVYPFDSSRLNRHSLGRMNHSCVHCGALKWIDERCPNTSKRSPEFATCCARGKVLLPNIQAPPPLLISYLT
ncbi:hypothetical protein C2G38_2158613 [Gigaspora rosea]|uniref:Uncharacterized protein n=1 Tax=Gigaspora rosea TaxID=44941 RepID=A0A397W1V1_9GLOM|nr:hypothetical protein C2G38_2158613 [Gigaspora rosea]